ncbi:MAG: hypothetical protein Q8Q39_06075 [bacterium]|nr:hypothetical protein [bacterium]
MLGAEYVNAVLRMSDAKIRGNIERMEREHIVIRAPYLVWIGEDVVIGEETIIEPFAVIQSGSRIGNKCRIGPFTVISESVIGNASVLNSGAQIYASTLGEQCEFGDIQIVRSTIGNQCKGKHGRYIGDATLGHRVNWGAGAIIANYDGNTKHRTVVGDGAFIGCNAVLVGKTPPLVIGEAAVVGASSCITRNVPAGALAVARAQQVNKEGWKKTP